MGGDECSLHVFLSHNEGDIALRRALCDRNDVHVLAAQCAECSASNSRNSAHVLSHYSDNRNFRIEGNVLHLFMCQIHSELTTKRLDRVLRQRRRNDQANIVLRGRLRNQQYIGSRRRGRRERAAQDVRYPHDSRASDGDQREVADRRECLHSSTVGGASPARFWFPAVRARSCCGSKEGCRIALLPAEFSGAGPWRQSARAQTLRDMRSQARCMHQAPNVDRQLAGRPHPSR